MKGAFAQTCTSNFAIKDNNNNNLLSFNANNDMTVAGKISGTCT